MHTLEKPKPFNFIYLSNSIISLVTLDNSSLISEKSVSSEFGSSFIFSSQVFIIFFISLNSFSVKSFTLFNTLLKIS